MNPDETRLLVAFRSLPDAERYALLSYADFLAERVVVIAPPVETAPISQPSLIPGAEDETVVAAIKRLRASYPMLSRRTMLDKVAVLMSDHMILGRERKEVIVALETVFAEQYQLWISIEQRNS